MSLDKNAVQVEIEELRVALAKKERHLEKLANAPLDIFKDGEPSKGTVLRFTRTLGSSDKDYSFTATKTGSGWYVAGKKTTLANMLGLSDGPNTWENLLLAMSGATEIEKASDWTTLKWGGYTYYVGGYTGKLYRQHPDKFDLERWDGKIQRWNFSNLTLASSLTWITIDEGDARRRYPEAF